MGAVPTDAGLANCAAIMQNALRVLQSTAWTGRPVNRCNSQQIDSFVSKSIHVGAADISESQIQFIAFAQSDIHKQWLDIVK